MMKSVKLNHLFKNSSLNNFGRKYFTLYTSAENPKVFFEISKDGKNLGRLTFELYANHCKKTAENFRQLCTGEKNNLTFKNNVFHRIITDFMAQGGDITAGNGTGGVSIYGRKFADENLKLKHFKRGLLSMANSGPDTNGSQFFITFGKTPWLDGKHVVFGELVEGDSILKQIEGCGTGDGTPRGQIKVTDCGEIKPVAASDVKH